MKKKTTIINFAILFILATSNICMSIYFFTINNTKNIFNNAIMKTVEIKVSDDESTWSYATGCFIDKNGTILTNKHVAFNSSSQTNYTYIKVRLANVDDWIDANIIRISQDDDLALLKIEKETNYYFSFGSKASNGDKIFTIGNPNGLGLSFAEGVVSSSDRNIIYNGRTIKTFQTSLVINEGNSGGPVFASNCKLIGLISFRLKDKDGDVIQGVSFAIPIKNISEFVK